MTAPVHLARKWRSATFDQIIGQDVAVGMLKNSLYTGKLFPVYLFAGQHGCGKTTTARVFACAINCERLLDFQRDPRQFAVPCLQCASCQAMARGKHPDFIEIDAASHTGVDHVRQIVDAASLMPLVGRKKIYLIDEAHMLSKAAFNAFLKMLEEPPAGVVFMLATTDEHKILDTVKSRSFQLFFNAVAPDVLYAHMVSICDQESMVYEPDGLRFIIKETGGSVRDALNVLEQVYLSAQKVGYADVARVLGAISAETLLELFTVVVQAPGAEQVLACVTRLNLAAYNAGYVWQQWVRMANAAVWLSYGVPAPDCPVDQTALRAVAITLPAPMLVKLCMQGYADEPLFAKTAYKDSFLALSLVRAWQLVHEMPDLRPIARPVVPSKVEVARPSAQAPVAAARVLSPQSAAARETTLAISTPTAQNAHSALWADFLQRISSLEEPLLLSVFKQAGEILHDEQEAVVRVNIAHRLALFNDTITQLKPKWEPVFKTVFGEQCHMHVVFVKDAIVSDAVACRAEREPGVATSPQTVSASAVRQPLSGHVRAPQARPAGGAVVNVADKERWPLTHRLMAQFPGTVVAVADQAPAPADKQPINEGISSE